MSNDNQLTNGKIRKSLCHGWLFKEAEAKDWYSASVPGCNFTDLLENKLISDPFWGTNESELQWIETRDWEYQTTFELTAEELTTRTWSLDFAGLDTWCDIYLNDALLATSCNMFVPLSLDCHKLLKSGSNRLRLYFHSPIKVTRPQQEENGFVYPAENDKSEDKLSVYNRKAPYHFGWDWGPRFVTSGIWRPVELVGVKHAHILDVQTRIMSLCEERADMELVVTCSAGLGDALRLELLCDEADVVDLQITYKQHRAFLTFGIMAPKLWWPNGLGEAFLYNLRVSLKSQAEALDEVRTRVGLRTIELINEEDADGLSFFFKVNGHPVFIKGANYIPGDSFLNRVGYQQYQQTISDALAANMNMLRVWGGGAYMDDAFYDLADENGIMIWQDFMFACSLYPGDARFIDNVTQEAVSNIKRLRNHPAIAMWCGNNEVEMGMSDWQWPEKFNYDESLQKKLKADYHFLFRKVLAELVTELDPERFYLSSSPIGFWEHPEQDNKGNHHYWGVWHGEQPFSEYRRRIPRFMSEYGFQSFPLIHSVKKYIPADDMFLNSASMTVHQKHPRGNSLIAKYMSDEYKQPKDFASMLYLSQVQQAWGLKQAFDSHRLNKPYCMGTIYWQFNDCWPVASWSGIDYYGRWKALHYQAARSFKPVIPVIECSDEQLQFFTVNDTLDQQLLTLHWRLLSFDGKLIKTGKQVIDVKANTSERHLQLDKSWLLGDCDCSEVVLIADLITEEHELIARDNFYFVANKQMALRAANISTSISGAEPVELTLTCHTLVKDLHIEIIDIEGNVSDNFFDLLPGEVKTVRLPQNPHINQLSQQDLLAQVRFTSVVDTWHNRSSDDDQEEQP